MTDTDPEAQERVAKLQGEHGDDAQFAAVMARTDELIDQAFSTVTMMAGSGAAVASNLIYAQ